MVSASRLALRLWNVRAASQWQSHFSPQKLKGALNISILGNKRQESSTDITGATKTYLGALPDFELLNKYDCWCHQEVLYWPLNTYRFPCLRSEYAVKPEKLQNKKPRFKRNKSCNWQLSASCRINLSEYSECCFSNSNIYIAPKRTSTVMYIWIWGPHPQKQTLDTDKGS